MNDLYEFNTIEDLLRMPELDPNDDSLNNVYFLIDIYKRYTKKYGYIKPYLNDIRNDIGKRKLSQEETISTVDLFKKNLLVWEKRKVIEQAIEKLAAKGNNCILEARQNEN